MIVVKQTPPTDAQADSLWRTMCATPDRVCARSGRTQLHFLGVDLAARLALRDAVIAGVACTKNP